jgi:hypothetical protein
VEMARGFCFTKYNILLFSYLYGYLSSVFTLSNSKLGFVYCRVEVAGKLLAQLHVLKFGVLFADKI